MTTFDDADLFTDAFRDFRGVGDATRRRSGLLTALALVAAAALVAAGLVWVRLAQHPVAAAAVDPSTTLAVFAQPQRSSDVVDDDDLAGSMVVPSSTRLVAHTADTRYYAGVSRTHLLCVLALTSGELPTTSCVAPDARGVDLTVDDSFTLVTTGGPAPAAADGWHEAGPEVYLKD